MNLVAAWLFDIKKTVYGVKYTVERLNSVLNDNCRSVLLTD